jgi:hypothetical protein
VVEWLKAPDCKFGARKRYAGSNPALPTKSAARESPKKGPAPSFRKTDQARALHSGNALAFQARVAGSIPAARSSRTSLLQRARSFSPLGGAREGDRPDLDSAEMKRSTAAARAAYRRFSDA